MIDIRSPVINWRMNPEVERTLDDVENSMDRTRIYRGVKYQARTWEDFFRPHPSRDERLKKLLAQEQTEPEQMSNIV